MRWGKHPREVKPDDKRLRCTAFVSRDNAQVPCQRLAKHYRVLYKGSVLQVIDLCPNHCSVMEQIGFSVELVEQKRKGKKCASASGLNATTSSKAATDFAAKNAATQSSSTNCESTEPQCSRGNAAAINAE